MLAQGKLLKLVGIINRNTSKHISHAARDRLRDLNVPVKPKKPLTGYFRFVTERRPLIIQQNPNLKVTEVVKRCSEEWKTLNETEKQKYVDAAKIEMERYAKQYLEYSSKLSNEQREAIKAASDEKTDERKKRVLKKRIKDSNKPKRPMGAYMYFLQDLAEKHGKKVNELFVVAKQQYYELSEAEKKAYQDKYTQAKIKYDQDLILWEKKMIKEGNDDLVRESTLRELKVHKFAKTLEKNKQQDDECFRNVESAKHDENTSFGIDKPVEVQNPAIEYKNTKETVESPCKTADAVDKKLVTNSDNQTENINAIKLPKNETITNFTKDDKTLENATGFTEEKIAEKAGIEESNKPTFIGKFKKLFKF